MCIQEAIRWALAEPNQLIFWVAPNYKTAREVGFEELMTHVDVLEAAIRRVHYSNLTVEFINGSKIIFKSGDNPDALRGRKIDLAILDEAAFIKKDTWMVMRPALADSGGHGILISTPNGRGNYFHEIWESKGWSKYHWPSDLNPLMTEEEIKGITEHLSQTDVDQEILAKFITRAGRVYNDFSEENQLDPLSPSLEKHEIHLGMDFGFASPSSIVFMAVDKGTKDKVVQFDEIYVDRTQIDDIVALIVERLNRHGLRLKDLQECYCDPAGEAEELSSGKSPVDTLRKYGFMMVNKATRINPGLALVRAYIKTSSGKRRFFVTKNCKETIRSFMGYQYAMMRGSLIKEEPLKDGLHDHACDAVRYFFVNKFDHAKYVAKELNQHRYLGPKVSKRVWKRCAGCRQMFISKTAVHEPPFVCNQCEE